MTVIHDSAAVTAVIREAGLDDRDRLMTALVGLAQTSEFTRDKVLNEPHLQQMLDALLGNPLCVFVIALDRNTVIGVLSLVMSTDLISGEIMGAEACWYVQQRHRHGLGIRLLDAGESLLRRRGAVELEMLSPNSRFDAVYSRRGYRLTNRVFSKRL